MTLSRAPALRVSGAHRVAVHGGRREGRLRQARGDVFREDAAEAIGERHTLGRQRLDTGQEPRHRLVDRKKAHPFARARQSPERPPLFSSSRMSVIDMPRSAAFAMS